MARRIVNSPDVEFETLLAVYSAWGFAGSAAAVDKAREYGCRSNFFILNKSYNFVGNTKRLIPYQNKFEKQCLLDADKILTEEMCSFSEDGVALANRIYVYRVKEERKQSEG